MIEYLAFALLIFSLTAFLFAIRRVQQTNNEQEEKIENGHDSAVSHLRSRTRYNNNEAEQEEKRDDGDNYNEEEDEEDEATANEVGNRNVRERNRQQLTRLQKKKLKKEQERAERQRRAEEIAQAQERRRVRLQGHNIHDNDNINSDATTTTTTTTNNNNELDQDEAAALLRAEEDALAQLRAEKKEREENEYAQWKSFIQVDEIGELGDEVRTRHDKLVSYLLAKAKTVNERASQNTAHNEAETNLHSESNNERTSTHVSKSEGLLPSTQEPRVEKQNSMTECMMILQDAARSNNVTVDELVATVEELVKQEVISGVFDDRGRFIFIAPEHFNTICKCIRQRGRISVQELARECNRIIFQS